MSNYWGRRQERAQTAIADKTIEETQKQLARYYERAMKRVIGDFEATYIKILEAKEEGQQPTPADLYKLDQYWQMQAQMRTELQNLGEQEIALLSNTFEEEWQEIYTSIALPSDAAFSTIAKEGAQTMLNTSWVGDGKNFSKRIWGNTERLAETLNENLVHCIVTGKKPTQLRALLQERFNVSFNQANTLVKTEVANIQTQAAAQRYKDYGLTKYEFLGREEHDIGCSCKKLNGKVFLYSEMKAGVNAPPMHPNCRCAIIPVVDKEAEEEIMEKTRDEQLNKIKQHYPEILAEEKERRNATHMERLAELESMNRRMSGKEYTGAYAKLQQGYIDDIAELNRKIERNNRLAEDSVISQFIFCMDCGKPIPVKGRSTNAIKRCPECQEIYRKKYKAQKERERRAKKKQNNK